FPDAGPTEGGQQTPCAERYARRTRPQLQCQQGHDFEAALAMPRQAEPSNPRAHSTEAKLTAKQRRLIVEFEEIAASIKMDYWNILDYVEEGRTVILQLMKQQLVRSEIITRYTLLDEFLTSIICHYYFRMPGKQFSYAKLWRTKKFQIFTHYIMDE